VLELVTIEVFVEPVGLLDLEKDSLQRELFVWQIDDEANVQILHDILKGHAILRLPFRWGGGTAALFVVVICNIDVPISIKLGEKRGGPHNNRETPEAMVS